MKRVRHLPIVGGPPPSRVDTTALLGSRSQASTIFARNASAAGSERVIAKRCARSSLDIVSNAFGRPVRIGCLLRSGYPKPMQKLCCELTGQNPSYSHLTSSFSTETVHEQTDRDRFCRKRPDRRKRRAGDAAG